MGPTATLFIIYSISLRPFVHHTTRWFFIVRENPREINMYPKCSIFNHIHENTNFDIIITVQNVCVIFFSSIYLFVISIYLWFYIIIYIILYKLYNNSFLIQFYRQKCAIDVTKNRDISTVFVFRVFLIQFSFTGNIFNDVTVRLYSSHKAICIIFYIILYSFIWFLSIYLRYIPRL